MSLEDNKAVVRAMLDALDSGDYAALELHPGLYEARVRQPLLRAAIPDLRHTLEAEMAEGDMVAIRAILRGTHLGPFMGVPPTGRTVEAGILVMDRVVDGKIVQHWANLDWLSLLGPLGLIPLPPDTGEQ
jgi:ketosteroid isomerase-like protein